MTGPSLLTSTGMRKYLTNSERQRFLVACDDLPDDERLLCHCLLWTGARLSEVLALEPEHISGEEGTLTIRSLKKRGQVSYRRVPVPQTLLTDLLQASAPIFGWGRTRGWMTIKTVMEAADISGPQACPRGLRHSFAVHAISSGVPLHLVQRWLGHQRLETTAIYSQAFGHEERQIASRMWQ
ncbi:integrase family protein [Roseibium sp. TrichSKD4]|uniref:tyrosine-type recombinase/integrase n=1 Tax=Roseibium sp. TrichSKD4 TaxID=744980 RepID=UPI0001E57132|nr:site-specific integrase [Roseibium sp. TrichSKD4]EFO28700.1 integrase family protein [Roseibium sp. TrichSKD4]